MNTRTTSASFAFGPKTTMGEDPSDYFFREFSSRTIGAGLDVYVTERIGISLESAYVLATGRSGNYDNITVSWSLFYRFDNEDDE